MGVQGEGIWGQEVVMGRQKVYEHVEENDYQANSCFNKTVRSLRRRARIYKNIPKCEFL